MSFSNHSFGGFCSWFVQRCSVRKKLNNDTNRSTGSRTILIQEGIKSKKVLLSDELRFYLIKNILGFNIVLWLGLGKETWKAYLAAVCTMWNQWNTHDGPWQMEICTDIEHFSLPLAILETPFLFELLIVSPNSFSMRST